MKQLWNPQLWFYGSLRKVFFLHSSWQIANNHPLFPLCLKRIIFRLERKYFQVGKKKPTSDVYKINWLIFKLFLMYFILMKREHSGLYDWWDLTKWHRKGLLSERKPNLFEIFRAVVPSAAAKRRKAAETENARKGKT